MIINVFGEYINPVNIEYLEENNAGTDTEVYFTSTNAVLFEDKTRKEVADEINRQIGLLKDNCPF